MEVYGEGGETGPYALHLRQLERQVDGARDPAPIAGEPWTNSLGMEFAWIPAGEFAMGSPRGERGARYDEVQHEVRISQGFWVGKYEVTQGDWEAVMEGNHRSFRIVASDEPLRTWCVGPRCPVDGVSWDEAQEFIRRLNEREAAGEYAYRLPTEAEWEYAARAGNTGTHYGDWDSISSGPYTYPVGERQPNAWGLHDVLGNVWEWTADWYGRWYGDEDLCQHPVTDPQGPAAGRARVVRGGGSDLTRFARRAAGLSLVSAWSWRSGRSRFLKWELRWPGGSRERTRWIATS